MSNMTNKIESSGMAAGRSSSGSYAALIQELQKKVFDQLNAGIKSAVQGTENELFEAMEHAQDNDARSDCLDSIGFFRKHREAIADGFLSAHTDDFNLSSRNSTSKRPLRSFGRLGGWMDSEPSARTALSDSGCTA